MQCTGQEALTVDQFVLWATVLELDVSLLLESEAPKGPMLLQPPSSNLPVIDPYGIPAEQVIRLAFGLGIDFYMVVDTHQISESGVPAGVLEAHPDRMGVKLDAAYHPQNHPQFSETGVTMTLSFSGLHTCFFSWAAILSVTMEVGTAVESPPTKPKGLRLVKG